MEIRKALRIAWFSPLNINESGAEDTVSAYVSDELLPELKTSFEIDCYIDSFGIYRDFPTYHYLSATSRHAQRPYDLFFYQIEDHAASAFTRAHIGLCPGVALMHDLLFKLPGPEPFAFSPWRDIAALVHNRTERFPDRLQAGSESRPVGKREAAFAALPIFSSSRNLDQFRREIKSSVGSEKENVDAYKLSFPVKPFESQPRVPVKGEIVLGFCGSPLIEQRAHKILDSLAKIEGASILWLIRSDEESAAKELCSEFGVSKVEFVKDRSPERWREVAARVDCAFHTLFSVFGSPGPYLDISIAAKLPCIVTRFAEAELLPADMLFKIPPGREESIYLEETLLFLRDKFLGTKAHLDLQEKLGNFAMEFLVTRSVASELKSILLRHSSEIADFTRKWSALEKRARVELLTEVKRLTLEEEDFISNNLCQQIQEVFSELGWR